MLIDQLRKDLLHFTGVDLPIHMNTQALPAILIDDVEHSQFAPSLRRVMNKIPRPDMPTILTLGRKSRRYALSPALGLFRRHRQPKLPPQSLNIASPHLPTLLLEQSCDLRISQLRMLIGFPTQSSLQLCLPGIRFFRPIRVGATIQPNMPAGRSCRTSIPGNKLLCHLPLVSGAYNFFSSTSFNSSLPSISSASIRLSRAFSRWSSLSCLA